MFDFAVRSSSTNFCVQSSTSRGALRNALHKSTIIIITIVRVVYFCVYDRLHCCRGQVAQFNKRCHTNVSTTLSRDGFSSSPGHASVITPTVLRYKHSFCQLVSLSWTSSDQYTRPIGRVCLYTVLLWFSMSLEFWQLITHKITIDTYDRAYNTDILMLIVY